MQSALRQAARRAKAAGYFLLGGLSLLVLKALRLTNPAWASDKAGKLLRFIGPRLPIGAAWASVPPVRLSL